MTQIKIQTLSHLSITLGYIKMILPQPPLHLSVTILNATTGHQRHFLTLTLLLAFLQALKDFLQLFYNPHKPRTYSKTEKLATLEKTHKRSLFHC